MLNEVVQNFILLFALIFLQMKTLIGKFNASGDHSQHPTYGVINFRNCSCIFYLETAHYFSHSCFPLAAVTKKPLTRHDLPRKSMLLINLVCFALKVGTNSFL
jgi:hypothetical protein